MEDSVSKSNKSAGPQWSKSTRPTLSALPTSNADSGKKRKTPALPAVYQHRAHFRCPGCWGPPYEGQDWEGVLGDSHVRPLRVVVLDHHPFILTALGIPLLTLWERWKTDVFKLSVGILDKNNVSALGNRASDCIHPNYCSWDRLSPLCGRFMPYMETFLARREVEDTSWKIV